jgi:hypothetical protein
MESFNNIQDEIKKEYLNSRISGLDVGNRFLTYPK